MIIHQPEIVEHNDHTIIYSKVELRRPRENFPDYLWFRVPNQFAQHLSLQSDAFLIPGLLAGMHFQEDIEVRGTVSPRLAYHLSEYQYLLHFRMPNAVSPVNIKYAHLEPLQAKPTAVGSTFSGGVDSFFTLWKHLPQNQPITDYHITHALFILGFDILNNDRDRYHALFSRYQNALKQINIELLPLETNLVSVIIPRMRFAHFYGPVLIGAAHVFGNLFKHFFISSSSDYWQIKSWTSSSDPTSDPLLSTDTLDIMNYGATHRRVEKIKEISDWKLAQKHLRVCPPNGLDIEILNCSRCEKCVRTMIPIYALGKMKDFSTFEKPFTSNLDGLRWARKFDHSKRFVKEIVPFVRKHKPDLIPWLRVAALAGHLRYWSLKLIPKLVRGWMKRFGFFVDPLVQKYAFENPGVSEFIRSKNSSPR
jgi:hypothetical protein